MTTAKRIQTELAKIQKSPIPGITAMPMENDLYHWKATISGPPDTPFENGIFKLELEFTEKYPYKPPRVHFTTKIYHPNIDSGGGICLDILSSQWSPVLNIQQLLLSISSLVASPNPDDPLVGSIAKEYKNDRETYNLKVREWTKLYAMEDNNDNGKK
jgi:ubiquitin-conjugating enzyme E2 D/E